MVAGAGSKFANLMNGEEKIMREEDRAIIEQELRKIEKRDGVISAHAVVEVAKSPTSPLHVHFQWNDDKAAHEFRLWQARQLIAVIIIERAPNDTQRTFTNVVVEQKTAKGESQLVRAYVSTERVLDDPDLRQQVLEQAVGEIRRWTAKYRHFDELETVIKTVDKFCKRHEAEFAAAA